MRRIALAVMIGFASTGAAQTVRLADESGYILATEDDKDRRPTARKDVDVYWVKAQTIHVTQGGAGGTLLHGPFTAYHPNGQLRTQGQFKHGLKHGEWRSWNADGKLVEVQRWRSGVRVGHRQRDVPDREAVKQEQQERRKAREQRKTDRRTERKTRKERTDDRTGAGETPAKTNKKEGKEKTSREKRRATRKK
ncbi:MAG: hypothetical protein JNL52_10910 [Flavobacteriales bacterium]|nr:hypothetical protein [Flavobacteriales bacterium]